MSTITKRFQHNPKATICLKNNCVTVYDEVAELVNGIAVVASLIVAFSLVAKALK
ncbi:hypothetical protein H9X57_13870 [Flavobacterium piscinae]|uniref:hypothetical protein n=1 Tax=Flavobacterium piscinae TaxID=2506424 RepID=UPI0013E9451E|nr:hypothetical protein [Flavobacterium piscinae]MBC8884017.1 hypothetical protein [Flavobacterium piscinae]